MVVGTYLIGQSLAAAGHIYISPSAATKLVGETFAVQVRISVTSPINAAFVDLGYDPTALQVISVQRGTGFPNQNAPTTISGGRIRMQSTRNNSTTGDLHYATVTFKGLKTGSSNFSPQTSSRLINYPSNEVSYTTAGASFAIINPPPPVQPPPQPTPTQPAPTTPKTTTPTKTTPKTTTPAPTAPTSSAPTATNLQITNFAVTNIGYHSVTLTWNTNKPATSKANFGGSADNMPDEVSDPNKVGSHQLVIQSNSLRAGKKYAVRITSDDGTGPVTLDNTFATKSIIVSIRVTDAGNQPLSNASVSTDTDNGTTNEDGYVVLGAPEGSSLIKASKDDLSSETTADVALPQSEDAEPQEIGVVLGASDNVGTAINKRIQLWQIILLVILIGGGLTYLALLIRRKRKELRKHFPDLGHNASQASLELPHSMPGPTVTPSAPPPAFSTLPDLVRRDLLARRKGTSTIDEPVDMFSALDKPAANTSQSAPHPTIQTKKIAEPEHPKPKETKEPLKEPPKEQKPVAKQEPEKPADKPKEEHPKHKDVDIDPKDHSMRIHHDN